MLRIEQYSSIFPNFIIENTLLVRFLDLINPIIKGNPYYAELSNLKKDSEDHIDVLIGKKLVHSIAAVGYFDKVLKNYDPNRELKSETIIQIFLFEFVQVDIADTLGEIDILRNKNDQFFLFENLKNQSLRNSQSNVFREELLTHKTKFKLWNSYILYLNDIFWNYFKCKNNLELTSLIDRRLTEYYNFIALDHVSNIQEKNIIKDTLIKNTYVFKSEDGWKIAPEWVSDQNFWLNFLGDSISFLVPIFHVNEFPYDCERKFLLDLLYCFRTIGFLNVFLDDVLDIEEDHNNSDSNVFIDIENNLFPFITNLNIDTNENFFRSREIIKKLKQTFNDDFNQKLTTYDAHKKHLFLSYKMIYENVISLYYCMGVLKKINISALSFLKDIMQDV